jgi:hypothetical protein
VETHLGQDFARGELEVLGDEVALLGNELLKPLSGRRTSDGHEKNQQRKPTLCARHGTTLKPVNVRSLPDVDSTM